MEIFVIILLSIIVAIAGFLVGFLIIVVPYLFKSQTPKQYQLKRNDVESYQHHRDSMLDNGTSSTVDSSTAVNSFKTE